jgi:hypothetical protein
MELIELAERDWQHEQVLQMMAGCLLLLRRSV